MLMSIRLSPRLCRGTVAGGRGSRRAVALEPRKTASVMSHEPDKFSLVRRRRGPGIHLIAIEGSGLLKSHATILVRRPSRFAMDVVNRSIYVKVTP